MSGASPTFSGPPLALLGPQRLQPIVRDVRDLIGLDGPIAVVTAGWQEREPEQDELIERIGTECVNLRLYHRADAMFERCPELLAAHRDRRDRRAGLRRLYRLRLSHALDAARALQRRTGERPELLEAERASALDDVRRLDAHMLEQVLDIREDAFRRQGVHDHPEVQEQRAEICAELDRCAGVAIAGGHVRILLDVLLLFDLVQELERRPVMAWSAGAMALGDRVVLFHDSPPQGAGNAEIHGPGLDLYRSVLPLPHARRRLRLDDPERVGIFARRFASHACLAMDEGSYVLLDGGAVVGHAGVRRLTGEGAVVPFEHTEVAAP